DVAALSLDVLPQGAQIGGAAESATLRPHAGLDYLPRPRRIRRGAASPAHSRLQSPAQLAGQLQPFTAAPVSFLYERSRHLLHIGYDVSERRLDTAYYDLLASEMRLGSFFLVATGKLPQEHWFRLGRQITTSGSYSALLSWSGSMFEYLMPLL